MFNLRIFKSNVLLVSLLVFIAAIPVCRSADSASPNDLDKIIIIEGESPRGTGFISIFRNKMVVVSSMGVLNTRSDLKLKDINGEQLSFGDILIPEDKRGIVFFELASDENKRGFLSIDENVSENCALGSNIAVYGYRTNIRVVVRAKGKVLAIGPELLDLNIKTPELMSGGPVISRSSRNVVAVFSDIEMRKAMGIRIDTIGNLLKFDKDLFNKELDAISRIGGFVSMFESEKAQFESKILEFKEKVDHFKKIGGGKVYVVKAAMERESKAFVKNVRSVIPEKGWSLPFVKEKYDLELKKAGEVLNSFNRLKAELDDVYKKSNQIN